MRCENCQMNRTRLHRCVICTMKICGCCSFKKSREPFKDKRVCCYPGDKGCSKTTNAMKEN